tara:strand:+ start:911 stop:1051 length:141 start_codon:yes stop_codon:yes gene_type:complete
MGRADTIGILGELPITLAISNGCEDFELFGILGLGSGDGPVTGSVP